MMRVYSYWRSSTSYRVRIALHLKGLPFETHAVDLVAGEHRRDPYRKVNPIQGVPALVLDDGTILTQSMAILDYLDGLAPDPALLPSDAVRRAQVLAAASIIACDVHPVNNLKILARLEAEFGADRVGKTDWMRHWMAEGLTAYQTLLPKGTRFSFSDRPLLADVCLIPQLYNAHRWGLDLAPFGRLLEIEAEALALSAFQAAAPESQTDAPQGQLT